jgi:hypothetical protein
MTLHLSSVLVITALVVNVSGILFILETFLRRDEGAGRIWSVGFLAAMLTTLAYAVWAQSDGAWWPVAVGNAAFVAGTGFMWLGCRRFNARRMTWAAVLVAVAVLAAGISVAVEGDRGGDWAGALWMFAALVVFAGAGAVECFRGALRRSRTAWVLGAVLAFQSLYYVARTTVFVVSGPESDVFQAGFGTMSLSFLTVTLTIVAVVVTSVLRASRAPMRGYVPPAGAERSTRGIEPHAAFARSLAELCERAGIRSEPVAVTSVRIDDLEQISSAFGSEVAGAVGDTWRASVRKHAPANAPPGGGHLSRGLRRPRAGRRGSDPGRRHRHRPDRERRRRARRPHAGGARSGEPGSDQHRVLGADRRRRRGAIADHAVRRYPTPRTVSIQRG